MRLDRRLLLSSLVVVGVLATLFIAIANRRLSSGAARVLRDELAREGRMVAAQWTPSTPADALADRAGAALGHRVTLVDRGGRVVGDSDFDPAALARLEPYDVRPEVAAALADQAGRAHPAPGRGGTAVAVAAPPLGAVVVAPAGPAPADDGIGRDVWAGALVATGVALMLAFLFSRAVSRPIVELSGVARAIASGDLARRPPLTAPGEVGDLAVALHRMAEQLAARLEALQADEALMTALIESLDEGVVAVGPRGRVVRINDSGRRLLGVRAALPFAVELLPREPGLRDALAAALAGEPTEPSELRLGERTLAITARPLPAGGAVLALFDLTALRRLEAVRRDFVANVSHELKTPLTVISGFAETLAEDDPPTEQRRRFADVIRANARRMQRIVDDLLDLSRIESGGWVPNPTTVDVRAVASDAFAAAGPEATRKGLAMTVAVDERARHVYADPTAARQIVGNLVDNAVRHTTAGAVTVFAEPGAGGTWLGVRDTGAGIPADHLPRIFERFYRVDPGRSREQGGTGLGLAIVRHLAEAHGGRVRAESVVGRGTTIAVFFPDRGPVTDA
ncbi:MAG TPA: ATP-binding protein [Gemmatimonadaceae bacterium]|nr:ATP-binding protein [Gemmatimonadaceae bacterium]